MSHDHPAKPLFTFLDQLWEDQRRRYGGATLDINALDDLDPVHYRTGRNSEREFDYDGDMGREHDDHMRDNGAGGRSATVAGTFVQIAEALPVIEAPSIAAELPEGETTQAKVDNAGP